MMNWYALFPLGLKDSARQWWGAVAPGAAESSLLSLVPHLRAAENTDALAHRDPYGKRIWQTIEVTLSGKNRALHEYSVEREGEKVEQNLVMLHGYGAGLGFFYKNFEPLSRAPGWKLYALDMLGMGNSSRPKFTIHSKDKSEALGEAEGWFIDALEEWRVKRKIEKFTLLAHSLGGYMAVAYALKYPGHLNKLILVSPAGIAENPYEAASTIQAEFQKSQESLVHEQPAELPPRRQIPGWVTYLWDANISPFSFIRYSGPLGPSLVSGWSSRRFNHLPVAEAEALHDYAFSIFRQVGSGEYVLPYVLSPGAFARHPMVRRIAGVGRQTLPSGEKETGVPVVMMYGDGDWMDAKGGVDSKKRIEARRKEALQGASPEVIAQDKGSAKVVVVSKAGHHLYLDNPDEFNAAIRDEMDGVRAT